MIPCIKIAFGASFIGCTTGLVKIAAIGQPIIIGLLGKILNYSKNYKSEKKMFIFLGDY